MKIFRVVFLVSLVGLIFLGGLDQSTYAKKIDQPEAPTVGVPADKNGYGGPQETIGIQSTELLKGWAPEIWEISDSSVKVNAVALTYTEVDEISISLYLQIWNESKSSWVDFVYLGENSTADLDEFSHYEYANNVPQGYYYRGKAVITATSGLKDESITTTSKYIYLD